MRADETVTSFNMPPSRPVNNPEGAYPIGEHLRNADMI